MVLHPAGGSKTCTSSESATMPAIDLIFLFQGQLDGGAEARLHHSRKLAAIIAGMAAGSSAVMILPTKEVSHLF
jgi:hypothetical protein